MLTFPRIPSPLSIHFRSIPRFTPTANDLMTVRRSIARTRFCGVVSRLIIYTIKDTIQGAATVGRTEHMKGMKSLRGSRSPDNRSYSGRACPTAQEWETKSDIKHAVLQVIVNALPVFLCILEHLFLGTPPLPFVVLRNEISAEVASGALAGQVGVIGRWD